MAGDPAKGRAKAPPAGRPWRGLSPSERDEGRRRRLLDAGLELFGTTGYGATTVQGICQHAGVSSRSFYELFDGREALLESVYVEATDDIVGGLGRLAADTDLEGPVDVPALVRAAVVAAIGPMLRDERLGRVVEIEAVGVSDRLEDRRRRTNRTIAQGVDALVHVLFERGAVPRFDTGLLGLVLVGGVTEALIAHLNEPPTQRRSADEFVDEMARIALRLIGVPG